MARVGALRLPLMAATYQTLIGLLAVTGLRVGELIRLNRDDVDGRQRLLRIVTKFGKSPTHTGGPLSRDAVERRLAKHIQTARRTCPTLQTKRVTMHTLRHTSAVLLLTAGIDTSTIGLWLGHEQERTTTSTSTPTSHSSSARSTAPRPRTDVPGATRHPTRCSPSYDSL